MYDPLKEEPEEEAGWLVSYADMMTLIACFFILMMAFANFDPIGFSTKAEQLSKAFRKEKNKSTTLKLSQITDEIAKHEVKDAAKISLKDSELIITFSSSVLFKNGKAILESESAEMLESLIDVVKITNPNYRILVEGHSDDTLAKSKYKDQWQLSSARAAYVAKRFESYGFPKEMIVPIGRGDSQKITKSRDKKDKLIEQQARVNRRVVIRLLEPHKKKKVKFGLGVYFEDASKNTNESQMDSINPDKYEIKNK